MKQYKGTKLDRLLSLPAVALLSPLMIANSVTAVCRKTPCFSVVREIDALGRGVEKRMFSCGWFKKSAYLLDVLSGRIALCGVDTSHRLSSREQSHILKQYDIPTGLVSLVDVYKTIGLADSREAELVERQANGGYSSYIALLAKGILCKLLFSTDQREESNTFDVFGLQITNDDIESAIQRVVSDKPIYTTTPRSGFFINANTINLALRDAKYKTQLQKSNWRFAEGSGVRVAALSKGYQLKDNLNTATMLLPLCKACAERGKRLFLLGGEAGLAEKTAKKLQNEISGLQVAGTEHGLQNEYHNVIEKINKSNTDVLLVAMNSPMQEQWINAYSAHLRCDSVLAVGNLFDYHSGRIPSAPRWMKEIGMEWLYRFYKQPVTKFTRYVIGTPEFLIRTFIFKQA